MRKLLAGLLAAFSLLRADFELHHWQYRRPIQVSPAAALSEIVLDSNVYRHSLAQLNDLRIIRDGSEIPYELNVSAAAREEANLPLRIMNKAFVPGHGLQATLDLAGHPQHNRLRISTAQRNFKEAVRIETSDDGKGWNLARSDALIFDISRQDRKVSDLTVEYPLSTRRYLRLTIPGWNDPAYLQTAWLSQVSETNAVRDQAATLIPVVDQAEKSRTTSYTFDIGFAGQPYDELELSVGTDLFSRTVEVFTSNDGKHWLFAGASAISNRPDDTRLQFHIPEQWSRYLRLDVANGDSPPVRVKSVTLRALRRKLRFPSAQAGRYWLYTGNTTASRPQYDLTQIDSTSRQGTTGQENIASAALVSLGPGERNAQYEPSPLPWTDRNPHLLTGLVIAAAIAMAAITVRLLLRMKAA